MLWVLGVYLLNTAFMLIVAFREAHRPVRALTWLTTGLVLPIISFGLYVISSHPVRIRQRKLTSSGNASDRCPPSFSRSARVIAQALRHLTVNGLQVGQVQVLTNGVETYAKLLEALHAAQSSVDLEYYIYRDDDIGSRITNLLIERANAGVHIRFLKDGWGSRKFPRHQVIRMMDAGIECRTLFPVRFPWLRPTLNYRDHCKNVVIDGVEVFTGGINVGDEYTGLKPNVGFWRDTHVRIIGKPAVDVQAVFDAHWNIASPERGPTRTRWHTKAEDNRTAVRGSRGDAQHVTPRSLPLLSGWASEWGSELGNLDRSTVATRPNKAGWHKAYLQTLEGNPGTPIQVVRQAYFICLTQATKAIDITTPYFVPDADIIMAIKTAVARGVRVRLLVPHHPDHKVVGAVSRTYYGQLLEAGVHIYLYDKGILHAKVMVIDREMSVLGAANYDMRSFRLDYEVCEVLYSSDVARELMEQFERDLSHSIPLLIRDLRQRSRSERILEQGARLLSAFL